MTTIGFLHTSAVHVPTFDGLTHQTWPLLATIHVVDETLLTQARAEGPEATRTAVLARLNELNYHGADIVCCTCSTIGDIAEQAEIDLPVFRVDRPMARRAVALGPRIGVVAALESTLKPTRDLIAQEAEAASIAISVELVVAGHSWSLFEAGDMEGYIRVITESALALEGRVDVIVLAQASMAPAERHLIGLSVPILSSPRLAVEHAATSSELTVPQRG
ncbi:aspartate/glutamate racemase family protein [Rhodococcus sp. OK302]|uniref:aspartate/glutamate racemase family protein n=1 Tax=Rhodococcus sp. OK302 TaxID=1882769 RepID=UPI000B93E668|nr:aspartate/glutamate racemase family protein [Rhodococcus sp. OK302]OYD71061.1 hypothetical protein BDB13_4714 [Rhodococcus sp. OK302]